MYDVNENASYSRKFRLSKYKYLVKKSGTIPIDSQFQLISIVILYKRDKIFLIHFKIKKRNHLIDAPVYDVDEMLLMFGSFV